MKKQYNGKKIRYGTSGMVLCAVVIVAVILLNALASALAARFSWMYVDMTPESLYTISDTCFDLLREEALPKIDEAREYNKNYNANGGDSSDAKDDIVGGDSEDEFVPRDENAKVKIYFMQAKDLLQENSTMRYIHQNANEIANEFPDYIEVVYVDLYRNPSAVDKFKASPLVDITSTHIVVEFGSEYRLMASTRFYAVSNGEAWAYDGEKRFAASILAVTRAESPICLVDMAHGEIFYDYQFLYTLEDAGYVIASSSEYLTDEVIQKTEEECGGDVRLILVYNPTSDFMVPKGTDINGNPLTDVDEIATLDAFLDGKSSMMVFLSPASPVLPNLEEYLEEWGISFDRHESGGKTSSYMIKDTDNSLTSDGFSVVANYVTNGLGGSLTQDMRSVSYPKKVIFRNAMSISYSDTYTKVTYDPDDHENSTATEEYSYGTYFSNGVSRSIYDVFTAADTAVAMAGGETVRSATLSDPLRLMTVSCEQRSTQESMYSMLDENSYVVACGSVEFATEGYLQSAVYGNTDLLLTALTIIGREPVPVGITFKPFGDYSIDSITTSEATAWTVCLALIPTVVALVSGVVILVRRKYA